MVVWAKMRIGYVPEAVETLRAPDVIPIPQVDYHQPVSSSTARGDTVSGFGALS